jgi:hypothetical protein
MKLLTSILSIIFLISCKQENYAVSNFEFYPDTATINKNSFYKQKIDLLTSIYNLPTVTKGTNDSLIIRFWPWEAFELWSNLFEFRLDSNGWTGYHYCSYTFPNQDGKIIHVDGNEKLGDRVFVVKQITPKCGWDKFYDSIKFFKLRTLPTQKLVKGFQDQGIMDGDGVDFEIATKNSYRWIQYNNPNDCSYQECKSIVQLTEMIVRQLGNDYSWPRVMIKKIDFCDTKNPLHF